MKDLEKNNKLENSRDILSNMLKNITIAIIAIIIGFTCFPNFSIIFVAAIPFGWSLISKIFPYHVVGFGVGILLYYMAKVIIAFMVGVIAMPIMLAYDTYKYFKLRNQEKRMEAIYPPTEIDMQQWDLIDKFMRKSYSNLVIIISLVIMVIAVPFSFLSPEDLFPKTNDNAYETEDLEEVQNEKNESYKSIEETQDEPQTVELQSVNYEFGGFLNNNNLSVTSTSFLEDQGQNSYKPENVLDGIKSTAWVEGVNGYGKGSSLTFFISNNSIPIKGISVLNGYCKSQDSYYNNSAPAKLAIYIDGKHLYDLYLNNNMKEQYFVFDKELEDVSEIRFEIADTYAGEKWDDTAISEIKFGL